MNQIPSNTKLEILVRIGCIYSELRNLSLKGQLSLRKKDLNSITLREELDSHVTATSIPIDATFSRWILGATTGRLLLPADVATRDNRRDMFVTDV